MKEEGRCSRCGAALPAAGAAGQACRRCLLALGLLPGLAPDAGALQLPGGDPVGPGRVGPYRILDVLGTGSVGVVYLAEQMEPVPRRVALKVVRSGLDSQGALARFQQLRETLAPMMDPSIARVFDVGTTEDGQPFLSTEWIPGVPITEYCDRECLPVPRRLRPFVSLCESIERAHAEGILHRNIKPSNVLAFGRGKEAELRVTDLGVATALDQGLTEEALCTAQGLLSAAPAYQSPEQLDPARPVDARTDVYSLGVLLFELLVGAPPFEPRRLRQVGWTEMVRIVREEAPPAPSRRVREGSERASGAWTRRGADPRELARQLRGDLDAIVLKALEKDPARRYPTPGELGLDVQRHLDGRPVSARPPGLWSRLGRTLRRSSPSQP